MSRPAARLQTIQFIAKRLLARSSEPWIDQNTGSELSSKDDGKTAAENDSDTMVMGAVRALSEFSPLVSQQNHSDLSLKALEDALKRFYQKKCIFRE
jgi:hypothetical protein